MNVEPLDQYISLSPGEVGLLHRRALFAGEFGNHTQAVNWFRRAVRVAPSNTKLWLDFAVIARRADRDMMMRAIEHCLAVEPAAPSAHQMLCSFAPSVKWCRRAVRLDRKNFDLRINLGLALENRGLLVEAAEAYRESACLSPDMPVSYFNSGNIAVNDGGVLKKIQLYRRVIVLDYFSLPGRLNLAEAVLALGETEEAFALAESAIVLGPDMRLAYLGLYVALSRRGDAEGAYDAFCRADTLLPEDGDLCMNAASLRLSRGDFKRGWSLYERRWVSAANSGMASAFKELRQTRPQFRGDAGSFNKRVLVWAEQGVGDEVMFGGLLREFRGLCGEILLQVDRRLKGLFQRSLPGVKVYARDEKVSEDLYDEQIPMGSLGLWLRPSRKSFEGKGGRYLAAKAGLGARLRAELGVKAEERLIGLSWRSESPETGSARSLALKELVVAPSGRVGVRFVNLQYGEVREEIEALRRESGIEVLSHGSIDNREDLEGLAGLIEGCDVVVSVGNATAHLSGALGQSTWVLLPCVAGWRWLHEGGTCPWYQSVRLYRQSEPGVWETPVNRVLEQLFGSP